MGQTRDRGKGGLFKGRSECEKEPEAGGTVAVGPPRIRNFRSYARRRMAEEKEDIVAALIEGTKAGSAAHAKMLMDVTLMTKAPAKPKVKKRRGKTLAGRLLEEIAEMDAAEKAKATADPLRG